MQVDAHHQVLPPSTRRRSYTARLSAERVYDGLVFFKSHTHTQFSATYLKTGTIIIYGIPCRLRQGLVFEKRAHCFLKSNEPVAPPGAGVDERR
ncbi:hypothetical protein EVAR_61640_1 [Eumeta japonica]|uniref:Uncharacterized protein n=1 Tax=Eumeta variegata TaxID=151549 RepID=A0A4C1ZAT8_EUMVA|nr:hypothetical protein EVAR_61640_1 [Eumeta japonica]